jgi:hypothetical protein
VLDHSRKGTRDATTPRAAARPPVRATTARTRFEYVLGVVVHLAARGQAGRPVVRALCGGMLPGARVSTAEVEVTCSRCLRARVSATRWSPR